MPKKTSSQLDAGKLHDRSREAASEYHKLLTQLSTGVLAIYFLALTASIDPPLTTTQKIVALCSLVFMGLSVFFGVWYWLSDALRNYYWGSSMDALDDGSNLDEHKLYKRKKFWQRMIRVGSWGITISFVIGTATSIYYMALRLYGW
ncbi:MAG: hypothetical protein IT247_00620 [Bacteroidia bacterium]|nr:hypothetical protein [Bacteroidia bacterium]